VPDFLSVGHLYLVDDEALNFRASGWQMQVLVPSCQGRQMRDLLVVFVEAGFIGAECLYLQEHGPSSPGSA
jgi:hypothetical protein